MEMPAQMVPRQNQSVDIRDKADELGTERSPFRLERFPRITIP